MSAARALCLALRVAAIGALAGAAGAAKADLASDAAAIRSALERDGALVESLDPIFLEAGGTSYFEPLRAISSQDACVTIVVLASRTTELGVATGPRGESIDDILSGERTAGGAAPERTNAGLYVRTACRDDLAAIERVTVRMRSDRGAIERIVARSSSPPASLEQLIAEHSPGPRAAARQLEPVPTTTSAAERRALADMRAKGHGAVMTASVSMRASSRGDGELDLRVSKGCHSFDLFSGVAVDLDARLSSATSAIAEDRAETPDPHLERCVWSVSELAIRFSGAADGAEVSVLDALFPWPSWITDRWGARAAETLADLSRERRGPAPTSPPIAETIGGQGPALLATPVEPGRCYLASIALTKGTSRGLRLSATASSRTTVEQRGASAEGVSIAFCAEDRDIARIRVDAPSPTNWWVLSLWALGGDEAP